MGGRGADGRTRRERESMVFFPNALFFAREVCSKRETEATHSVFFFLSPFSNLPPRFFLLPRQ